MGWAIKYAEPGLTLGPRLGAHQVWQCPSLDECEMASLKRLVIREPRPTVTHSRPIRDRLVSDKRLPGWPDAIGPR
jgi:hypothetical protein